jgi:hypothetical protein
VPDGAAQNLKGPGPFRFGRGEFEAGLCSTPEAWEWSSHAAILNGDAPAFLARTRLYSLVGADGGDPHARYVELVKGARPH